MIGLVVVSHYGMAQSLLDAAAHIIGPLSQSAAISINPEDDMDRRRDDIMNSVRANDSGQGVIILTDFFGSTPTNLAISLMTPDVEVIAGFNLPMAIRFGSARNTMPLAEAAVAVREAGRKYITRAVEVLSEVENTDPPDLPHVIRSRRREVASALLEVANELGQLRNLLREQAQGPIVYSLIGHNLPPAAFTIEDNEILEAGEIASNVAAVEARSDTPRADVLQLCIAALKRVLALLKQLANWVGGKADVFSEAAAKSAGKAAGPAVVAGGIAAGLAGHVSELIEYLRGLAGL